MHQNVNILTIAEVAFHRDKLRELSLLKVHTVYLYRIVAKAYNLTILHINHY